MKLIADSGSTKTHWVILDKNGIVAQFQTNGLNPHYVSEDVVSGELNNVKELSGITIDEIYFYGAGCSLPEKKEVVKTGLQQKFSSAAIKIETDMLGAAIGMSAGEKSFVAILGTGSNACLFDGEKIIHQFISTGFFTGDEGSGGHLGKQLIEFNSKNLLPENLRLLFQKEFTLTPDELKHQFSNHPYPNRFAASFAPWILVNIENEFLNKLTKNSFRIFFEKTICTYPGFEKIPLQITGSVGFHFLNSIREVANEKNILIEKIKANPMEGLAQFHLKNY